MLSTFTFTRLSPTHIKKHFNCNDPDLNEFFHDEADLYLKHLLAVTYIFESTDKTIGFFCVHNDKISIKEAKSPSFWQKRVCENVPHPKRMKSFPAVKIGRLGIHGDYQSLGFGSAILDFIKIFFLEKNKTGCKFITVDAYNKENVLSFYEKNGFKYLTDEKQDADKNGIIKTRLMFYDLNRLITS